MQIQVQILTPAAILVLWSLFMFLWMAAARFPALAKLGTNLGNAKPGGRGQDLENVLPAKVNWKSHNYTHLMEQPTIFYPTVIILALLGAGTLDITLAWIYVVLRIIHSIWQATVNTLTIRFYLFLLSTFALIGLAIRALMVTLL